MVIIDKETVKYVANLARIELSDDELGKLSVQLQDILDFIDRLKQVDVADVLPTSHILDVSNVLRQDAPRPSLTNDKALKNAPGKVNNFFGVPKVIE